MEVSNILSWVISLSSVVVLWLMGDKTIWGPILGIINQVLWIAFVFLTKQWGLLLGVLLYTGVHARNLYFWLKQNKLKEAIS